MANEYIKFISFAKQVQNSMLKQEYKALKEASSEAVKIVRKKAPKRKKKRLMYNIQARTYTRSQNGFVVSHIGVLGKEKAQPAGGRVPYAGFYAHIKEFGCAKTPAKPYLKPGVLEAIPTIRGKLAEHLPYVDKASDLEAIQDEIITE